ncbi:acyl-CoA dehydrogenase [Sphingobium sp. 22B]|uniref:acyl-CoA dehydrogenase family protein n=1 Tax=unclassified Sphingobium TaxID=2611147 RepID=UPI000786309C|nr:MULTISPECIES: acyl-CoA dehydrogenase family protein [unclassified Sphingobium]KXU33809.1 acyl-CoA dehydrogenase [Sphingobium sp. AM]KYC33754.1 acyl-CoA dehydrogenase [Sphingobium sp. 22B]OAP33492.1 acyl-CoA dehydrogenase [Sphingobium sp. 20006FA]
MDHSALDAFRKEVRTFVRDALPGDIRHKVAQYKELDKQDYVRWQKILDAKGWLLGHWKKEWGGLGWDAATHLAFLQETALAGAPMIIPYGVNMIGPVLNRFGTDAQKAQWLPGIISSDCWWCQGYSEPGAGSDLASLKTTAVRDGNHYVVNGSKMWTTEAHWADMMHCLVRTDASGRKQEGISFLLIDMRSPGLSVRPIVTIDGQHHTNQTFFDDVRVPVENLVGVEGRGWDIAKFLLAHERVSIADSGNKLRLLERLRGMNDAVQADAQVPAGVKARLAARLTDISVQAQTLCAMERYFVEGWAKGRPQGADASMLKVKGTEVLQDLAELALALEGPYAAIHDPEDLHRPVGEKESPAQAASAMAHQYLYSRCWSIFGGSNEIQRNIIAKTVLAA